MITSPQINSGMKINFYKMLLNHYVKYRNTSIKYKLLNKIYDK